MKKHIIKSPKFYLEWKLRKKFQNMNLLGCVAVFRVPQRNRTGCGYVYVYVHICVYICVYIHMFQKYKMKILKK